MVAGKENLLLRSIETDETWSMTRAVDGFPGHGFKRNGITVI
jgi:hypothetical protein